MKLIARKALAVLALLVLSGTFFELGLWQLHRAQATKKIAHVQPERAVIDLENIAAAGHNLRDAAFNRLVTFKGKYIKYYSAPGQLIDGNSAPQTFIVGLMELSGSRAILVVRGVEEATLSPLSDQLVVTGRLYPHQNEDHANPASGILSRLDPALVANSTDALFDGYVIARSEQTVTGRAVTATRVPSPQLISTVCGFYWQHIAYIITWWFMAVLVWFAPFYNRAVRRRIEADSDNLE